MTKRHTLSARITLAFLGVACSAFSFAQPPLQAKFWATGLSTTRATYESLLAEHLLDITQPTHGPYEFSVHYLQVNYDRGRRVVAEGKEVNFFTNPLPARKLEMDGELNVISVPLLHGLLGYRVLIARKQDLHIFASIENYADLQKLKAGQVNYWADVPVYKENGLPLVVGSSFESLFFMLSRGRFDYIPLSAGEAVQSLSEVGPDYGNLAIVPGIVLYYPFPVFFQVSKHHPKLTARLEHGLKIAHKEGSLDTLFYRYFKDVITQMNRENTRLFYLKNSNIPAPFSLEPPKLVSTQRVISAPGLIDVR
ncbi:hypothetical protein [Teredinibacter haidensis]|uniref:hypothetical protein n=1 Tax=Teredinibacter haidensis TaxID=2731755 RepID=UPI000948A1AF|nr:hypothetical protein [Teredinibacter haidensis]